MSDNALSAERMRENSLRRAYKGPEKGLEIEKKYSSPHSLNSAPLWTATRIWALLCLIWWVVAGANVKTLQCVFKQGRGILCSSVKEKSSQVWLLLQGRHSAIFHPFTRVTFLTLSPFDTDDISHTFISFAAWRHDLPPGCFTATNHFAFVAPPPQGSRGSRIAWFPEYFCTILKLSWAKTCFRRKEPGKKNNKITTK